VIFCIYFVVFSSSSGAR